MYDKNNQDHKERNRKYQHDWYLRNKTVHIARVNERRNSIRIQLRDFVRELKETNPCTDCGGFFPYYVMDFDHLKDKKFTISFAVGTQMSMSRLKEEIEKCDLVCSNCHRIRTFTRR